LIDILLVLVLVLAIEIFQSEIENEDE